MIKDNTSAENYYLNMPIFSSGIELLAITICDLILRNDISFNGQKFEVSLNCDYERRCEHEKLILKNLNDKPLHLKNLIKSSLKSTSQSDYKNLYIYPLLENKRLLWSRHILTKQGRNVRRNQNQELKDYSSIIINSNKPEVIGLVHALGGNIYLFDERTKSKLKDIFPKCINIRTLVLKLMGVSESSDASENIYNTWGIGVDYSTGSFNESTFDGGGGGSFGGGGSGDSW